MKVKAPQKQYLSYWEPALYENLPLTAKFSDNIFLNHILKYDGMSWPGGAVISLDMLTSPSTYAVCPWPVYCECGLMQK